MVRTTHPRALLAGLGVGAVTAAAVTAVLTSLPANAQASTSTAVGVKATGVENKSAQPAVSSDGAVKTASGSVSGMGWSVTGITVKAGAGFAEASASNVSVGGKSIGSVSAKCTDGVTTYAHGGKAPDDPKLKVSFGGGAGATIQVLGAGDRVVQTVTVAVVTCAKGSTVPPTTPPTTTPPPTSSPTEEPTATPTQPPTATATEEPTATSTPTAKPKPTPKPVKPAPKPQIKDGHHPVTG